MSLETLVRDLLATTKVFTGQAAVAHLEATVRSLQESAQKAAGAPGAGIALLDIPLPFESGEQARFDAVVVVTAAAALSRERATSSRSSVVPERARTLTMQSAARQRAAFTIAEFCEAHRISRSQLYKLWAAGTGPPFMRVGSKIIITNEAAADWRREGEAASAEQLPQQA
jgi:dephospho-CoA kinase